MLNDLELIPFTEEYYDKLASWIPDAEFNMLWGGPAYNWPLDSNQIRQHISQEGIFPFVLMHGSRAIGFIELIKKRRHCYQICRVLVVREENRGKGFGTMLMRLAIDIATKELNAHEFELNVFQHNSQAINCYTSLGFSTYSIEPDINIPESETAWVRQKMKLKVCY